MVRRIQVNNNFPFFRFPFYTYPRHYQRNFYHQQNSPIKDVDQISESNFSEQAKTKKDRYNGNTMTSNPQNIQQKKSSKYSSFGPIFINTDGFSNNEEPILEFSGLKLYLDDLIILSLLFILYKEDVKDDMLFILLILLLIG